MFVFMDETRQPCWWVYLEELGIQQVIDNLKAKGLPARWPAQVADPNASYTFFHPFGKGFSCYKSDCPHYEGYYLDGIRGAVRCQKCPELLPGIVVDTMCRKNFEACPYYRKEEEATDGQRTEI